MFRPTRIVPGAAAVALTLLFLPLALGARALPKDVEQYLVGVAKFTPAETGSLEGGRIVASIAGQPGTIEVVGIRN